MSHVRSWPKVDTLADVSRGGFRGKADIDP